MIKLKRLLTLIPVLLNILIALYNSAYEDITDNAIDEYMALLSQKTMQFVRAPDENVFIARKLLLFMLLSIGPILDMVVRLLLANRTS